MNLREVVIEDYGPLDASLTFDDGIQVVFGPNESGKTLLVDALLWLLTGENEDDRVGQTPFGYVTLDEGDRVHRLAADETALDRLAAIEDIHLPLSTFRNSFVIRSADAALSAEDRYYDRATDVVAESLQADLERLSKRVARRGRVTAGDQRLRDRQDTGYVGRHRDEAVALAEDLEAFLEEAAADGVPDLEAELFRAEERKRHAAQRVESLREAKRWRAYERARSRFDDLAEAIASHAGLPDRNSLESLGREVEALGGTGASLEAVADRRDTAAVRSRRLGYLTAGLAPAAVAIGVWLIATFGPTALSILAIIAFVGIVAVVGTLSAYYWRQARIAAANAEDLTSDRERTMQRGERLGIDAESAAELGREVRRHQTRHEELTRRIDELRGHLGASLDVQTESARETLERAEAALDRRRAELGSPPEITFSEAEFDDAKRELADLEDRCETLRAQLEDARTTVDRYLERSDEIPFDEYGVDPPPASARSLDALERVVDRLYAVVETIETDADNARAAMAILDRLEREERAAVEELFFGAESHVTRYFSTITDGRYESVSYDETEGTLTIQRDTGVALRPRELSQSTFDQLYFAVRLGFAEELLEDWPGFFLLDDAFLGSDPTRLRRQVEVLDAFRAEGWQVVYFTAKPDARDVLANVGDAAVHELDPLE